MATNPRLLQLADEFQANRDGCDYLDALAAQEHRDLTTEERAAYDGAVGRMEVIAKDIADGDKLQKSMDETAKITAGFTKDTGRGYETKGDGLARTENVLVQYDPKLAGQPYKRPSVAVEDVGRFCLDLGRAKLGRVIGKVSVEDSEAVFQRYGVGINNEAGRVVAPDTRDELGRVVAHGVSSDGTAPVTIEGDLIKFVDANRYAVNAARQLPMPDNHAPTFKRPRASQLTSVGQQVNEGDVLSSQRLQLTGDTVTKTTRGGVLSLSEQEMDWTDPAMLGLAIQDLAEQYAIATDTVLTAAIEAAVSEGTETTLSLTGTAAQFIAALATSASTVYSTAKKLPDVLFAAPDRWAYLAGLTDTTGRPLFPIVGPFNDAGTNSQGVATFTGFTVMGLQLVVDPNHSTNILITGVSQLVEFYEQNKGLLTINVPSTLEVQYAYRGYVAANVYSQGLNGIEVS